jgi:hypothetical protein
VFGAAGFEVAGARLKIGFVPVSEHDRADRAGSFLPWIEYYNDHKLFLRATRPSGSPTPTARR